MASSSLIRPGAMRRLSFVLAVVLAQGACGDGSGSVTAPSPSGVQPPASPQTWFLAGQVRSLQTKAAVSDAVVRTTLQPSQTDSTNPSGKFLFSGTSDQGNAQVEIKKSGFLTRSVSLPWTIIEVSHDVTMIETSGGFDEDFWLEFVRDEHDDPGSHEELWRLDYTPNFYIRTNDMSSNDVRVIKDHLRSIVDEFTDGHLGVGSIETGTEDRERRGWITIEFADCDDCWGQALLGGNPGSIELKRLDDTSRYRGGNNCLSKHFFLDTLAHEVGHALGFFHVSQRRSIMDRRDSGVLHECNRWRPSSRERYHGGLAYQRKRGNTHPDKEPNPQGGIRASEPPVIIVVD